MYTKILIANRGEIAVRIIRACRNMGILTVAVYSKEDKDALHVHLADQRVCIGEGSPAGSYLNMDNILAAAVNMRVDAIHPGYGFLSENSAFARRCTELGIDFIGPDADLIDVMGNKSMARQTMAEAGVPVVPGTDGAVHNAEDALDRARKIGFPIMIKASSGGGGKGMRVSETEEDFLQNFNTAQRESVNAFADDAMYLERCIINPRHVEVQVIGDKHGHVATLGERDCSVQRNHQKMIEESPSPAISEETRQEMYRVAALAAKTVGYNSAGTIEFIVSPEGEFYFMEMNTRIQVEHPVTEMVTGIDLIEEQIRVSAGEPLSFTQEDVRITGHAIECRINAESPERGFLPCAGLIQYAHFPGGMGVRVDTAVYSGYRVPSEYDSMIAKVIVHAKDRDAAIAKMRAVLDELVIMGIDTNANFQLLIFNNPVFCAGQADTGFIEAMTNYKE